MNITKNLLCMLALISILLAACNFSIPTNVPIPTGLPEIPTGFPQIETPVIPPPQDGGTPAPMPIPVTGTDSPLLFYAFLALLAVIVLVALLAFFRRSDRSGDERKQQR